MIIFGSHFKFYAHPNPRGSTSLLAGLTDADQNGGKSKRKLQSMDHGPVGKEPEVLFGIVLESPARQQLAAKETGEK